MAKRDSEKSRAREAFEAALTRRAQVRDQMRRAQVQSPAMRANRHRGRG